jgi:predicted DNA-binding transcriptional regulator AlpA
MDDNLVLARGTNVLVGVAEVATRLEMSAERIRQLAKSGAMPSPIGKLGRQLVWQWRDVEAWAKTEGRLPVLGSSARPSRIAPKQPAGWLRLVVDEVMPWGRSTGSVCHVRVWAPADAAHSHVVLLGQLQDASGRSITNDIEAVAMTAAQRYLGRDWDRAQFYEYSPAPLNEVEFFHVTFTVRPIKARGLRRRALEEVARHIGAELVDPSWRPISREDLVQVTGDLPRIWAPGTYTSALLKATAGDPSSEVTWDPHRARDLADVSLALAMLKVVHTPQEVQRLFGVTFELDADQVALARSLVAQASLSAQEHSEQDARTQPPDGAIWLNAVHLDDETVQYAVSPQHSPEETDPCAVWDTLARIRHATATSARDEDSAVRLRRGLVPGARGGWVTLAWYNANVDEPNSAHVGMFGPIALPADLPALSGPVALDPFERLLLLDTVLAEYLDEHWQQWRDQDVPSFTPSTKLPIDGPLTRAYLDTVQWQPADTVDQDRLHRLLGVLDPKRVGLDPDGWLVIAANDGFACEWPVSGERDLSLRHAVIRADRSSAGGPAPVYIERDAQLHLLPSAPDRYHGNSYTWGYPGTGPANLATATLDLLRRAGIAETNRADSWHHLTRRLAESPATPYWRVDELRPESDDASDDDPYRHTSGKPADLT